MNNPCFNSKTKTDCPRRCVGCASACPDWAEYTQKRNDQYEQAYVEKKAIHVCSSVRHDRINKIGKYRHKKR